MPDLLWFITKTFGDVVSYSDVLWTATLIVCLLLLVAGSKLLTAGAEAGSGGRRTPLALLWVVIGVSLASGLSGWLAVPDVDDNLTPWHVLIMFWTLASVLLALALFGVLRGQRKHPLVAVLCVVAGLLLFPVLVDATLRMNAQGIVAPAALLYAAPLPIGGALLGRAFAWGHRRYALYVAAWFVAVATVGLLLYLFEMGASMYNVYNLSSAQLYSPDHTIIAELMSQATQAQVLISLAYFVVSLALLILPMLLSASAIQGRLRWVGMVKRTRLQRQPGAGTIVTPSLDDIHQIRGRA